MKIIFGGENGDISRQPAATPVLAADESMMQDGCSIRWPLNAQRQWCRCFWCILPMLLMLFDLLGMASMGDIEPARHQYH